MRKKLLLVVLGALVLAIGYRLVWFYQFGQIMQPEAVYAATLDEIAARTRDDLYFLQVNGQDPPPSLLQRFKGESFQVRKASEGKRISQICSLDQTVALHTGQSGTVLKLQGIDWQKATAEFGPPPSKYPAAIISLKDRSPAAGTVSCIGQHIQMIYAKGHWKFQSTDAICVN